MLLFIPSLVTVFLCPTTKPLPSNALYSAPLFPTLLCKTHFEKLLHLRSHTFTHSQVRVPRPSSRIRRAREWVHSFIFAVKILHILKPFLLIPSREVHCRRPISSKLNSFGSFRKMTWMSSGTTLMRLLPFARRWMSFSFSKKLTLWQDRFWVSFSSCSLPKFHQLSWGKRKKKKLIGMLENNC